MNSRSILISFVAVALVSSALTWLVGQQIQSPAERAASARAPEASLITVPVERQELSQNVVVRGTIQPSDSVEVWAASESESSTVVTGLPKEPGDSVTEGEVIAEISGRPIFALEGSLPVFRELRPGVSGPDIVQLEAALSRLGHDPGPIDGNYTRATSTAVAALYTANGYTERERSKEDQEALRVAQGQIVGNERALAEAKDPLTESKRLQLDLTVVEGERELARAKAVALAYPTTENDQAVKIAEIKLNIAKASRSEAYETGTAAAVAAAERALQESRDKLDRLETETGTAFPATELVFVTTLPQQIIRVNNDLGDEPSEAVLVISSSETVIRSAVATSDRKLLKQGMKATIDEDELNLKAEVKVENIATKPGGGKLTENQYGVELVATEPLPKDAVDSSVRVSIPVTSTDGEVLVVPLAAVSAGPDGKSRVEVQIHPESKDTMLVPVKVGLTAGGLVEVEASSDAKLNEQDQVVVGDNVSSPTNDDNQADDDEG